MPIVTMRDGTRVNMPKQLSEEQLRKYKAIQQGLDQTEVSINRPEANPPKSALSGIGKDIAQRGSVIAEQFTRDPIGQTIFKLPSKLAISAGQVAGGINDVTAEVIRDAIKRGYSEFAPEFVDYGLKESGKAILNTLQSGSEFVPEFADYGLKESGKALQSGVEAYRTFKKSSPEARDIALAIEGAGNLITAPFITKAGGKAVKAIGKETLGIASDITTIIQRPTVEMIDKQINAAVERGITKIRPATKDVKTLAMRGKFYSDAGKAVEGIIKNRQNIVLKDVASGTDIIGQLPETLGQFSDAMDQNLKFFFSKYDTLQRAAGTKGVKIDPMSIVDDLSKLAKDKVLNIKSPETAAYAESLAERFIEQSPKVRIKAGFIPGGIGAPPKLIKKPISLSPSEAQDLIKEFNADLKAFYANPSYPVAGKARIDAGVVSQLKKITDDAITKYEGPGWQKFRDEYKAIKTIQDTVNNRLAVDMRKNTKGLLDFTDIGTVYAAGKGLLKLDPSTFAAAATAAGLKRYYKVLNDPNHQIKAMLKTVEDLMVKRGQIGMPKSLLGRFLKEQKGNIEYEGWLKQGGGPNKPIDPEKLKELDRVARELGGKYNPRGGTPE